jgi:hypothetical protein
MENLVKQNLSNVRRLRGTHRNRGTGTEWETWLPACHRRGRLAAEEEASGLDWSRDGDERGCSPSYTVGDGLDAPPVRDAGEQTKQAMRTLIFLPPSTSSGSRRLSMLQKKQEWQPPRRTRPACSSSACAGLSRAGGGGA